MQNVRIKSLTDNKMAQLLCVQTGGTLVQDMYHPGTHNIIDVKGNIIQVTSSHHQMAMPNNNANILGFCKLTKDVFLENKYKKINLDIENVWYPTENALGIQSHPEWQSTKNRAYFIELIENFLADEDIFADKTIRFTEKTILKNKELMEKLSTKSKTYFSDLTIELKDFE